MNSEISSPESIFKWQLDLMQLDDTSNIKIDHVLPAIIVNPKPEYENVPVVVAAPRTKESL